MSFFFDRSYKLREQFEGSCPNFSISYETYLGLNALKCAGRVKVLVKKKNGAIGTIRTCDLLIRSQVLYPTKLRLR
jgi:hypothetical protein